MSIVKWRVSTWLDKPERQEYTKQTMHFFIRSNGGRDSIVSSYYSYFDSEADALSFIEKKKAQRLHMKNIDRIKSHGVELLEALENLADAYEKYKIDDFLTSEVEDARKAIAKAKGEA